MGGEQLYLPDKVTEKPHLRNVSNTRKSEVQRPQSLSRTGGASFQKETAASLSKAAAHQKSLIRSFGHGVGLRQSAGFEV